MGSLLPVGLETVEITAVSVSGITLTSRIGDSKRVLQLVLVGSLLPVGLETVESTAVRVSGITLTSRTGYSREYYS